MLKDKKILITGGAGFLGSHLAESLSANNSIVIVDNLCGTANFTDFDKNIEFINKDLRNPDIHQLIRTSNFDYVVHLAANAYVWKSVQDPVFDFNMNIDSTFQLLETFRGMDKKPKFIFASSAAVYDSSSNNPCVENGKLDAISPYAVSKLAGEKYTSVYNSIFDIPALIIRFFPMYGPRHKKQIIYDMMTKINEANKTFEAFGNGQQIRDLLYIDDAVNGIQFLIENAEFNGQAINLCTGTGFTIDTVIRKIMFYMKTSKELKYTGNPRDGDADIFLGSPDKLAKLGFKARVNIEEGIKKTVNWFMNG